MPARRDLQATMPGVLLGEDGVDCPLVHASRATAHPLIYRLAIDEEKDVRDGADAVLVSDLRGLLNVDLYYLDCFSVLVGELVDRWGQLSARPAPVGIEVHQHRFFGVEHEILELIERLDGKDAARSAGENERRHARAKRPGDRAEEGVFELCVADYRAKAQTGQHRQDYSRSHSYRLLFDLSGLIGQMASRLKQQAAAVGNHQNSL